MVRLQGLRELMPKQILAPLFFGFAFFFFFQRNLLLHVKSANPTVRLWDRLLNLSEAVWSGVLHEWNAGSAALHTRYPFTSKRRAFPVLLLKSLTLLFGNITQIHLRDSNPHSDTPVSATNPLLWCMLGYLFIFRFDFSRFLSSFGVTPHHSPLRAHKI